MYVCMSVRNALTGLGLKCTGLCIVYVPFGTCRSGCIARWHEARLDGMEIEVEDSEDRRRRQNESRCMEDG